jgi:hypothetical protein
MVEFNTRSLYPGKNPGSQRVGEEKNLLLLRKFESRTIQLVAKLLYRLFRLLSTAIFCSYLRI